MRDIRALTGLRGIGALAVLAFHMVQALELPTLHGVLLRGYLAVDLFFVLSGYVLARRYGTVRWDARAYARFTLRRFVRLWPVHAAVLLALLAAQAAGFGAPAWPHEVLANALMIQAWGVSQSIDIPSWSVSTEWGASLLFPALAFLALRGNWKRAAGAALGAAALLVGAALLARVQVGSGIPHGRRGVLDIYDGWSFLPLMRCLGGFTFGLLLHRVSLAGPVRQVLSAAWLAPLGFALLAAGLAAGLSDWWLYPLLPALVGALAFGGGWAGRLLETAMPHLIGELSFAIYLVHVPLINAWAAVAPVTLNDALWPLLVLVILTVAGLAFMVVERPCRAWGGRSEDWPGPMAVAKP